eukprot:1116065-Prymnesium_polylepis.1
MSECDPCTTQVYGDANGDCVLRTTDNVAIVNMIDLRKTFVGTSNSDGSLAATDPLDTYGFCDFRKQQFNPLHDLLSPDRNGITGVTDARYNKPDISSSDAVHVLRATQSNSRFIQPSVECVPSENSLGDRPDALIRASVYSLAEGDVTATASTATTDVFFHILLTGTPDEYVNAQQFFNASNGTVISQKEGQAITDVTNYAHATGTQHSVVIKAEYHASEDAWVVRVLPFRYVGDTKFYVAVATESISDGSVPYPDGYAAWLGTTIPPFGTGTTTAAGDAGYGFSFQPIIGDPYSAIQQNAT